MANRIVAIFAAIALMCVAWPAQATSRTPQFRDYPVTAVYHGRVSPPRLRSDKDRQFRTMLREGARQKPNFAGHYIVTLWGCGSGCVMGAVMDAKTGKVTWIPYSVSGWSDTSLDFQPIRFEVNSRLIVLTGQLNEQGGNGPHYFVFNSVRFAPAPARSSAP